MTKPQIPYPRSYAIAREAKYHAIRKRLNPPLASITLADLIRSAEFCLCPLSWHVAHYKLQFTTPNPFGDKDNIITMCPILIALGRQRLYFHGDAEDNLDVRELIRMAK